MADITVSQLTRGLPPVNAFIPFSNGTTTLAVAPSGLLVNAGKVGINTATPTSELTLSRSVQLSADSIELNVRSGITEGNFDGIKFTQTAGTYNELAAIRCKYFNNGQTALELSTRENNGVNLKVESMLTLDRNNGNVLNHGLILSGSSLYNQGNSAFPDSGVTSLNVARGWTYGYNDVTGNLSFYTHILLPPDFNQNNYQMFLLEIKGYNFRSATAQLINLIVGGYVTPVSNGGPIRNVSAWQALGDFNPTAYYSSTYNRGVVRFYLSNAYYASFVVNSICVGNGRIIKPGELQIIYSSSATL